MSAKEAFLTNKRRCKIITYISLATVGIEVIAGVLSQARISFVWLTAETLVRTGGVILVTGFVLLAVFAPRCPHCGQKVPQFGIEGERNVALEADACPHCLHSLPS